MSNIPSRTRSLRKPAGDIGNKNETPVLADSTLSSARSAERSGQSPSRLPVKPQTRTISSRPPSATGSVVSNASSIRPAPSRVNISKPTTSGLQRSSSTRTSNAASSTEPIKTDRSRPPVTQSRHLRNASTSSVSAPTRGTGHARAKSSSTILNPPTLRPPTRESNDPPRPAHLQSQITRPAFSTLQQHFSPAKNLAPKPHPAAFLAPPSPSKLPSNIAISAETAKLQNELLQLHILHKSVPQVETQWRSSAKRKLGIRFSSVVEKNQELAALEIEERGKINAAALQQWQETGTPGWGLEERIQVLDEVVIGVWNLGEAGGKYARIVGKFERWIRRCQDVLDSRSRSEELPDEDIVFLEELDSGWKDDCLVIGRKLETWRDHLKHMGSPDPGSSLATVVEGCRRLVRGMLVELVTMAQIEKDAMAMEVNWIRGMNDDTNDDDDNIPPAGAIWRRE
ncbi:hypothetical protein D0Z07_6270 [Hyphodiscus hymeniophilus]|uniref:AGA1 A-agglutinin anchor subunit n=1 Tax=Hyphodiscus hymeniophilus TaxID=353542 RepID=A0A9P6VF47_9HELO|nr:hypothetical protein D0Z07_6270 [Hyphodiscus hymeniophilus]